MEVPPADDDSFGDDTPDFQLDLEDRTDNLEDPLENLTLSQLCHSATKNGKLTYHQFVAEKATNLFCLAQTDQVKLGALSQLLDQLTSRLRNGHSITVALFDATMPLDQENPGATPAMGTLKSAPNTYNHNQFKSTREIQRKLAQPKQPKRSALLSLVGQSNDLAHVPPPRPQNKTCSICRRPGHQRGSCPKIHKFKAPPLDMGKSLTSHHELSTALSKVLRYKISLCPLDDQREVSISLPNRILGLVIHQRFYLDRTSTKMCLECTILGPTGDCHTTFQNFLFNVEVVASYVTRSKKKR
jgi:hypothetical protein